MTTTRPEVVLTADAPTSLREMGPLPYGDALADRCIPALPIQRAKLKRGTCTIVEPGHFVTDEHYYPRVLNAQLHPLVSALLNLDHERLISRYCHLNPRVDAGELERLLTTRPRFFGWAGADLFNVTDLDGRRQMVVIETNSCPSGQKSMPLADEHQEQGGYRKVVMETFRSMLSKQRKIPGRLAVIYDKNPMETSGYAAALADDFQEPVFLAELYAEDPDPPVRFDERRVMHVRDAEGVWHPIRAAYRYVTQRPWTRIPVLTRTAILNPVLACLAGGRNKMIAAKAYELFNASVIPAGLGVRTPETIRDVRHNEIPLWVQRFGGHAVVKIPYSNAGQGVFTITSPDELTAFMAREQRYDQYIVQSLVGNYGWSSHGAQGRLFHVGTVPNRKNRIYAADLRCMIHWTREGFRPVSLYARRAREPLAETLESGADSWAVLGTNLSVKNEDGTWGSDTKRLMLMDQRDFNRLGVSLDDLIDAFVQTVQAVTAIDRLAQSLVSAKGKFRFRLFRSLNDDLRLIDEIRRGETLSTIPNVSPSSSLPTGVSDSADSDSDLSEADSSEL